MKKRNIAIALNILLIIMEIIGFALTVREIGYFDFQYYTQDSNLLSLAASCFLLYYLVKGNKVPRKVSLFKYISVVSLCVTFLVVLFVLVPMYDFNFKWLLFSGSMIFYHMFCPIIAFISFAFLEEYSLEKKDSIIGISFTIIYAIILIVLNIFGVVSGPYPFLKVTEQSVLVSLLWIIVMIGGSYLISMGIRCLNNKNNRG